MASSRKTEKYGLSQFDTIDDPSWYTDYNQDMQILDGNAMSKTEYDPLGAISEAGGIKPAIDAASAACAAALKTHVDDKANPHGVTAAQAGDTANPHGVTATQAGTYTKAEIDALLAAKANNTLCQNQAMVIPAGYKSDVKPSYWKTQFGEVFIKGRISKISGSIPVGNFVICTLPVGYRPKNYEPAEICFTSPTDYLVSWGSVSPDGKLVTTIEMSRSTVTSVQFSAHFLANDVTS